jgi:hypothetical protein
MKTYSSEKGKAIFSIPKKMAFAVNVPGVDVLLNEGSTLHNLTMLCNISLVIHLTMIIIVYGSILPPFPNNWVAIVGWHGRWLPHFSQMVLPPPPTPFYAQWARSVNCQNR